MIGKLKRKSHQTYHLVPHTHTRTKTNVFSSFQQHRNRNEEIQKYHWEKKKTMSKWNHRRVVAGWRLDLYSPTITFANYANSGDSLSNCNHSVSSVTTLVQCDTAIPQLEVLKCGNNVCGRERERSRVCSNCSFCRKLCIKLQRAHFSHKKKDFFSLGSCSRSVSIPCKEKNNKHFSMKKGKILKWQTLINTTLNQVSWHTAFIPEFEHSSLTNDLYQRQSSVFLLDWCRSCTDEQLLHWSQFLELPYARRFHCQFEHFCLYSTPSDVKMNRKMDLAIY